MRRKDQHFVGPTRGRRLDFNNIEDDETTSERSTEDGEETTFPGLRPSGRDERGRGQRRSRIRFEAEADGLDDRIRRERSSQVPAAPEVVTLLDLCVPVFGYAALLPTESTGVQPGYQPFRKQVLESLQCIEQEAPAHGIDVQDARDATYALSVLLDSQVADSQWLGRSEWAREPMGRTFHHDPEAGVNFFKKIENFTERQADLKAVYLVCLALGYEGQYAQLQLEERAPQLGEIRRRILRSIHPAPMDRFKRLFPEAYVEAEPIVQTVPAAPGWWWAVSIGTVVLLVLFFLLFSWIAGELPEKPLETMQKVSAWSAPGSVRGRPC